MEFVTAADLIVRINKIEIELIIIANIAKIKLYNFTIIYQCKLNLIV